MSTNISGGDLRVKILKRDRLDKDSEVCINELCTLDISRIRLDNLLTTVTIDELQEIKVKLSRHFAL